jgi:restriction system protein
MYGGGRPVNRQMVTQLSGDALLQDCTEAMLVTDGRLLDDAMTAAKKLDIEIRYVPVPNSAANEIGGPLDVDTTDESTFDGIWAGHVMALVGEVLERPGGSTNQVLAVDWTGLKRRSSTGSVGTIDIEIFRWTVEQLLNGHVVLRDEINAQYPKRASSGVVLILGSLPMFETVKVGSKQGLRLKHSDERA